MLIEMRKHVLYTEVGNMGWMHDSRAKFLGLGGVNMFRLQIQDKSTVKYAGLKIDCDTREDYELPWGAKALSFKGDDSLKIEEEGLRFDGYSDYIGARVMISEDAPSRIHFLKSERLPFFIHFVKQSEGRYQILVEFETVDERKRVSTKTMISNKTMKPGEWNYMDVLFLDGEFYLLVENEVWIRRIFEGSYNVSSYGTLCFGGNGHFADLGDYFRMYEISLSKDIYTENDEALEMILDEAVKDKLFLYENAYYDAVDNGYDPGPINEAYIDAGIANYTQHVFRHGVIWEDEAGNCVYINEQFYKELESMKKNEMTEAYPFSMPKAEVILEGNGVSFLLFKNWALFYLSREDRFLHLQGVFLNRYVSADTNEFGAWYPISEELSRPIYPANKTTQFISYMQFSNGLVMALMGGNVILIPSSMFAKLGYSLISSSDRLPATEVTGKKEDYKQLFYAPAHLSEGIPEAIADYSVIYDNDGKVFCYCLPCKGCWAYYFTAWNEVVLTDRNIGTVTDFKIREKERDFENYYAEFCNFDNGIVVFYKRPEKKLVAHSSVELRLDSVVTRKINDFFDTDAEVFLKLSVYTDKGIIIENKQLGSKSLNAGKNYTFNTNDGWNRFLLEPLQSGSYIRVIIKVYDYDAISDEDYLGRFDYQYDIFNGWGIDFNDTGMYTLPMTEKGDDSEQGVWTCILTLALGEHYSREELTQNWRTSYGFPFGNFKGSYDITTNQFARVFDNVKALSDLRCNFWKLGGIALEGIFFLICEIISSYGKCGGFSISSAEAYFEQGPFIAPLYSKLQSSIINDKSAKRDWRYEDIKPEIANPICDRYYRQVGWDFLMWVWKKMTSGEFDSIERSIEKIRKRIDSEGCCLVLIYPKNLSVKEAHLTLAYKYEGEGLKTRLFLVESTRPYTSIHPNDSCVMTFKKDRVYLYEMVNETESLPILEDNTYSHVSEIPFSLVNRRPRIPSVLDFLVGGMENMVLGLVEGTVDTFGGDVELDPLITNREWADDVSQAAEMAGAIYEISIPGADGSAPDMRLFLCDKDNFNLKVRTSKAGVFRVTLVSSTTRVELETTAKEKETFTISAKQLNEIHGAKIGVKRTGAETPVDMILYRSVKPGLYSHKFRQSLNVNRNGTVVEGSKFGIRLTASKMKADGEVSSTVHLKAQRNIKISRSEYTSKAPKNPGATVINKYFNVKQYAKIYGCTEASVRQACRDEFLTGAFKKNRKWVIPASSRIVSTK